MPALLSVLLISLIGIPRYRQKAMICRLRGMGRRDMSHFDGDSLTSVLMPENTRCMAGVILVFS